jgi:hypothetical protein
MDPEIQAEIEFGIENSRIEADELIENVTEFLEQGDTWLQDAEEHITDLRQSARLIHPEGSDALARAARLEVEASSEAWSGRWAKAGQALQRAATVLGENGDSTRGYRAMLLYLAGVWCHRAGSDQDRADLVRVGRALVQNADEAAQPAQWVKEMRRLSDDINVAVDPTDEVAAEAIANALVRTTIARTRSKTERMMAGLSQQDASKYEPALSDLGQLLGAEASKPQGSGRCDSVWRWKNRLWIALEAKSEHKPNRLIPLKDIRQANDQLRLLQKDVSANSIPEGSKTLLISPRQLIDPSASGSAESHVFLVTPDEIIHVAKTVAEAWQELLSRRKSLDDAILRRVVLECLNGYGVLPSQVLDQLTENPASDTSSA